MFAFFLQSFFCWYTRICKWSILIKSLSFGPSNSPSWLQKLGCSYYRVFLTSWFLLLSQLWGICPSTCGKTSQSRLSGQDFSFFRVKLTLCERLARRRPHWSPPRWAEPLRVGNERWTEDRGVHSERLTSKLYFRTSSWTFGWFLTVQMSKNLNNSPRVSFQSETFPSHGLALAAVKVDFTSTLRADAIKQSEVCVRSKNLV